MAKPRKKPVKNEKTNTTPAQHASGKKPFHVEFMNAAQKMAWGAFDQHDVLFLLGAPGTGKSHLACAFAISEILAKRKEKIIITRPTIEAGGRGLGFLPGPQPLTAKLATPDGWITMSEVKLGCKVIGRDGMPTEVIGIYPKGKKDVYKVTTTDGTSTECCIDHLWYTQTAEDKKRNRKGSVKSTKEILESLSNKKGKINHFLPRNEEVHYDSKILPISPYALGVLLGDGSFSHNISFSNTDQDLVEKMQKEVEKNKCYITNNPKNITYNIRGDLYNNKTAKKVKVTNIKTGKFELYNSIGVASEKENISTGTLHARCTKKNTINEIKYEFLDKDCRWSNPIKNIIENLGLLKTKAYTKFIPSIYKYSSVNDRLELLRGLMDTDGTVKKSGEASFTTISKNLADDVIELVRSLGGRATLRLRNRVGKTGQIGARKITTRYPSYEFTISLPEKMNPFYISRKANRFSSKYIHRVGIKSIELVGHEEVQCIKVDNPEHLYLTDNFIVTHNTADEKLTPYMLPLFDCMDRCLGTFSPQRDIINKSVELAPLQFMRGRSFHDSVCILDEAQNCNYAEIKLFLTRFGQNSKVIITGDPMQSDLPWKDRALMNVVDRLSSLKGVGIINFKANSIVRHPLIASILEKLEEDKEESGTSSS
jgi:phosphate starvation-inducible PhoH-like protein